MDGWMDGPLLWRLLTSEGISSFLCAGSPKTGGYRVSERRAPTPDFWQVTLWSGAECQEIRSPESVRWGLLPARAPCLP